MRICRSLNGSYKIQAKLKIHTQYPISTISLAITLSLIHFLLLNSTTSTFHSFFKVRKSSMAVVAWQCLLPNALVGTIFWGRRMNEQNCETNPNLVCSTQWYGSRTVVWSQPPAWRLWPNHSHEDILHQPHVILLHSFCHSTIILTRPMQS